MATKYIIIIHAPNGTFYESVNGNHIAQSKHAKKYNNQSDALKSAKWIAERRGFTCYPIPVLD